MSWEHCLGIGLEQRTAEWEEERPSPVAAFQILDPVAPEVGSAIGLLSYLSFLILSSQCKSVFVTCDQEFWPEQPCCWILVLAHRIFFFFPFLYHYSAAMLYLYIESLSFESNYFLEISSQELLGKRIKHCQGSIDVLQIVSPRLAMICLPNLHSPTVRTTVI